MGSRSFPSKGLTARQMCGYIRMKGLELEYFTIRNNYAKVNREFISLALKAYTPAGLPIIANLAMKKPDEPIDYHAVVISGIALSRDGRLSEIYVHDDRVGPYTSVFSDDGFLSWKYGKNGLSAWTEYSNIALDSLIVPLYHKFRLPSLEIWMQWSELRRDSTLSEQEIFLHEASKYKSRVLSLNFTGMEKILTMPPPH